jgi:hypothetical protein
MRLIDACLQRKCKYAVFVLELFVIDMGSIFKAFVATRK